MILRGWSSKTAAAIPFICALAMLNDAEAARLTCRSSCKVQLKLDHGKPVVRDDPIVIAGGRTNVHVNWRAPEGWEFLDGGVALKQRDPNGNFDQWCASSVDNDDCASKKPVGSRYHCRALNVTPRTFEYRIRLRKVGTTEEHEIDPSIVNQGR
jgi:hypothetical protein